MELPTDDAFKVKQLTDRVRMLVSRIQMADDSYHAKDSDDNLPAPMMINGRANSSTINTRTTDISDYSSMDS